MGLSGHLKKGDTYKDILKTKKQKYLTGLQIGWIRLKDKRSGC